MGTSRSSVQDATGFHLDKYKDEDWSEEQVIDHREVTSPDLSGVVLEKGRPGLVQLLSVLGSVTLDGTFADLDTQFQ
jgi:hypothetical protein